ncbi:MAG: hypothetical protein V4649_01875 [Bacteroidota bacterium]
MGWKASTIIIHNTSRVGDEKLLQELGFSKLTKIKDETFETVINPDDNKIYIGSYRDNIIICDSRIPMQFFEDEETLLEKKFKQVFPNSEVCAITLHSVVNLWGYSVVIDGKKARARAGSADDGTFLEYGLPLAEEKELLSKSKLDNDGNRIYVFDDCPGEIFSEDQVGENFVFSVCKRYFGEELDSADNELFDTNLLGFRYKGFSKELRQNHSKPWWKFW